MQHVHRRTPLRQGKKSKKAMTEEEKMMESAKKKFAKFDTDGNEVIDTQEAKAMAESGGALQRWVGS